MAGTLASPSTEAGNTKVEKITCRYDTKEPPRSGLVQQLNIPLGVLLYISPQALSERPHNHQHIRPSLGLEEKISLAAIPLSWRDIPLLARSISRY